MSLIKCPECRREVSSHAPTCPHCGVPIVNNIKRCPICSTFVLLNETQCPQCHAKFIVNATVTPTSAPPPIPNDLDTRDLFSQDSTPTLDPEPTPEPMSEPNNSLFEPDNDFEPISMPKRHYLLWLIILSVFIISGFSVFYYFQQRAFREEACYEQLSNCRNPENFKDFLNEYPNSKHIDSVSLWLNNLEVEISTWQRTEASLDKKELQIFIKRYPTSPFNVRANLLIDSLDWKTTERIANIRAYETYMANHDNGTYYTYARQKRDSLIKVNDSIIKARKAAEIAAQKAADIAARKKAATQQKSKTQKANTKKR